MTIAIHIPGPPVPWMRTGGSGKRRFSPKVQVAYQNLIKARAREVMQLRPPMMGPMFLTVRAYFEDRRVRDLDNVVKQVSDSLNGIIWIDDSQVSEIFAAKSIVRKGRGHVSVWIEEGEDSSAVPPSYCIVR